uniref:Glycosyltransferase family 61 protein n=1 Tax=viral metagenome TaxID=1070528 RepID=A0A6C0KWN1_9ZZZZ
MNINNLFELTNKLLTVKNTFICIYEFGFFISIFSMNIDNFICNYYSDEWLYLINYNYPHNSYYQFYVDNYNCNVSNINNFKDIIYFDKDVISLMNTFSRGSIHGYSSFYYTLITYLNNFDNYKDKDIILYKDTQLGMLSVINYLCNIGIITANIIYLEKNTKYKFKSVTYIPNHFHVFQPELENMVDCFIKKYNIINNKNKNKNENEKICIIKSSISEFITNDGVFDNNIVEQFCNKYNIVRIFPNDEIELINLIHNCKILIINYGSTFFKNYVYISDLCEKIIVIVYGNTYINDYNYLNSIHTNNFQGNIYKKYKNATITYLTVDNNLNINPEILFI